MIDIDQSIIENNESMIEYQSINHWKQWINHQWLTLLIPNFDSLLSITDSLISIIHILFLMIN